MFFLVSICAVFFSVLLILVVFVQKPKQDGISSQFGSTGANQLIGVTKAADLMEQVTWGLAATILALTLASTFFLRRRNTLKSPNIEKVQQEEEALLPEVPAEGGSKEEKEANADKDQAKATPKGAKK